MGKRTKSIMLPWSTIGVNLGLLAVVLILMRFAFPGVTNWLVYQTMLPYLMLLPILAVCGAIALLGRKIENDSPSMAVTFYILAVFLAGVGYKFQTTGSDWQIAEKYKPKSRPDVVEVDTNAMRFTPHEVALKTMGQKYSASDSEIGKDYLHAVDYNHGFGFVAPLVPHGALNVFQGKNPGFIIYDDNPGIHTENRIKPVAQPQEIGVEMMLTDNLERVLYDNDFWSYYPEVFQVQLEGSTDGKFVAIAPKIKYEFVFPFFRVPYLASIVLVHDSGKIEDIPVEQARKDPRLKGKKLVPDWLAKQMVESQVYDQGYFSGWFSRPGKIEVPKLPGDHQMPFFTQGKNGASYLVTATEPAGPAYALFRMYYIDAHSEAFTYYEWNTVGGDDSNKGLIGPVQAASYVRAIGDYLWADGDKGNGNFLVVEPIYLTRKNAAGITELLWKYSIVYKDFSAVAETVLVYARTTETLRFKKRDDLEAWLRGENVAPVISSSSGRPAAADSNTGQDRDAQIRELRDLLQRATEVANKLQLTNTQPPQK